jgi:hypothetical protein
MVPVHLVKDALSPNSSSKPESQTSVSVTPERQARRILNRALDFAQRLPRPNKNNQKEWEAWPNSTILKIEFESKGNDSSEKPRIETATMRIKGKTSGGNGIPLQVRVQARVRGEHGFPDQILGEIQGGTFDKLKLFSKDTELRNQHSPVMILQFPDDKGGHAASVRISKDVLRALKTYYSR